MWISSRRLFQKDEPMFHLCSVVKNDSMSNELEKLEYVIVGWAVMRNVVMMMTVFVPGLFLGV